MQPGNPYHLIEAVGSCQVGSVWSAIDPQGRSLMVALLDSNVATDQRWREAFQEAANALVQAGEPGYLYANFAAGSPWVAYAAENGVGAERVFLALGMDFRPVPPDGAGPVDHTQPEPTTQLTPTTAPAPVQPAAPDTLAQQQPLPPAVIEAATPAEAPPAEAPPTAAEAPPTTTEAPDDAESTQPTQRMEPAPVTPWTNTTPPQAGPVSAPPVVSLPPQPTSGVPGPTSGIPQPTSGVPRPTSGVPQSGAPWPVSGAPMSPAFSQPLSPAYGAPAYGPRPPQGPAPYDPYAPAPPPRRSRTGLWIGIAVAVLVLIAGGGGVYAWSAAGDDPAQPEVTASASTVPLPTSTARSPGIEPPQEGTWNASWPKFGSADRVRQLNLEGVGFAFSVPDNWDCLRGGGGEGSVEYDCGPTPAGGQEIGGEVIVRDCPKPCNGDRRAAMRKAEEAWGLRWQRTSPLAAYAETNQIDGQPRYGLVIVAYWRSTPNQSLDRQLVFRMTAPVDQADVLRKISNSVRSGALF